MTGKGLVTAVAIALSLVLAAAIAIPAYAASPDTTIGPPGGGGSTWTYDIDGSDTTLGIFYQYECDTSGCYPVNETQPTVGSYWTETWSGSDTGDAETTDVCMWGIYTNPSSTFPLNINDVFTEWSGTGSQVWSGSPAYSNSCNVLTSSSWQWYAGDNYPLVELYYPNSITQMKVVIYSTDNMVSPQSQDATWSITHAGG
ncbi:MAG: hypothetical protein ACYCO4_01870 [Sulfobacillus sp.]